MHKTMRYKIRIGSGKFKGQTTIQALCHGHVAEWRKDGSVVQPIADDYEPWFGRKSGDECEVCEHEERLADEWLVQS